MPLASKLVKLEEEAKELIEHSHEHRMLKEMEHLKRESGKGREVTVEYAVNDPLRETTIVLSETGILRSVNAFKNITIEIRKESKTESKTIEFIDRNMAIIQVEPTTVFSKAIYKNSKARSCPTSWQHVDELVKHSFGEKELERRLENKSDARIRDERIYKQVEDVLDEYLGSQKASFELALEEEPPAPKPE
jgi:Golgi nucleoside diphosphatase